MRSIHTAVLLLATAEPPVSAAALPDQTGSTYQRASVNGLSKRGPALVLVLEELDLTLDELDLTLEELATEDELDLTLEETTELELDLTLETTELATEEELGRTLEELTIVLELERLLEETGQLAPPPTTPYGEG